eukprot:872543-Ditylum_brightwellii.AAC.1
MTTPFLVSEEKKTAMQQPWFSVSDQPTTLAEAHPKATCLCLKVWPQICHLPWGWHGAKQTLASLLTDA